MTRFVCHVVTRSFVETVGHSSLHILEDSLLIFPSGQASLPEACPVCLHEPISKDDCKPNKALRTTIKIFMKKKIMERETAKKKEESSNKHAITAATPQPDQTSVVLPSDATAVTDTSILTEVNDVRQNAREPSQAAQVPDSADTLAAGPRQPTEAEKDVPQQSIEVRAY